MADQPKLSNRSQIGKSEYYQLLGLRTIADRLNDQLSHIEAAALAITEEVERDGTKYRVNGGGHTGDFIYGSRDLDELLRLLGIDANEKD